jgi:hypothetical protein
MTPIQNTRSIAVGTGPDIQALINEWAEAGFVVESSHDGDRWWHRRISPEYIKDVNLPTNPINLFAAVDSSGTGASEMIGRWLGDGYMVASVPLAGTWLNRAGQRAGAK